jgi:membrane-bound lytic murein transglycosylase B
MRWLALLSALAVFQPPQDSVQAPPIPPEVVVDAPKSFDEWLMALTQEARDRGYSDDLIDETLVGVQPLTRVIQSDRSQAELNPGFSRYATARLSLSMVGRGKDLARVHSTLLERIKENFGVQRRFLIAIWGMESRYGRLIGTTPVFQALATLAWEPRRAEFFRGELFNALTMVQRGHIEAQSMTGSWAGAMGQTQFMPSSYLKYAVDFDGDARRDIWKSTPDALASIANYLMGSGWKAGETWGREVAVSPAVQTKITETIPKRAVGCYALRNMTERRPLSAWRALGVRRVDGSALPKANVTAGLVDVGERKFLVYPNYDVILGYNCAHYYALTVGLLADRLE